MPQTPAQEAARKRATEAARKKAAERRAAEQRAANTPPPEPVPAFEQREQTVELEPEKLVRWTLGGLHDTLAVLTGVEEMRLSTLEEGIAAKTITQSLEMSGLVRWVVYLCPFAAVFVLLAIEASRIKIMVDIQRKKAAEAAAKREHESFAKRFDETVEPAREARAAQQNGHAPAASEIGIRAISPEHITAFQEES